MAPPAQAPTPLRHALCVALPFLLAAAPAAALAQDLLSEQDYFDPSPVVLTVSRLAQPLSDTPGAVTILDRKTLQDFNVRDMADILRLVPGYYVSGYNGANPIAVYHAPLDELGVRNLVLVDGRPAYSSYFFGGTTRGLMSVNPEDVERVEVLRGANSAAFGANAMFGVINIVTRHSGDSLGAQFTARVGEGNLNDARLSLGRGDDSLSWRLSASRRSDNGLRGLNDDRDLRQLRLRLDARPSARDELQIDVGISDLATGEGFAGDVGNVPRTLGWRDWHVNGQWRRQLSDNEQVKLAMSLTRERLTDRFIYPPLPVVTVDFSGTSQRLDLELQHQFATGESLRWVWGTGLKVDTSRSVPLFYRPDSLSTREVRLFGNLEWRLSPRWLVNAGVFTAHHSWVGAFTTPRVMANFQLAPDHTLRFGANRSVRMPTLFELAGDVRYDVGGVTIARTNASTGTVRPERLSSQEIGYYGQWREQRLSLDVRWFREKMKGLIGDTVYQLPINYPVTGTSALDYVNKVGPTVEGIEYQLRWSPTPRTDVTLSQAFNELYWPNGITYIQAPNTSTTLAVSHEFANRVRVGLMATVRDDMAWRGVGTVVPAYHQLDLHLAYPFRIGATAARLALTLRGLGGDQVLYQSTFARPLSRRQAYASLQLEF